MRIISKFKDYYDGGQGFGIDLSLVYVRKNQRLEFEEYQAFYKKNYSIVPKWAHFGINSKIYFNFCGAKSIKEWSSGTISFCGKIYRYIEVIHFEQTEFCKPKSEFFYDFDSFLEFLDKFPKQKECFGVELNRTRNSVYSPQFFHTDTSNRSAGFLKEDIEFHQNVESPIVAFYHDTSRRQRVMEINPCLDNFQFYKVVDPYSAFQEISMFIGGVMPREAPEMSNISDKHLRDSKGFDEWSFKTLPTKKRRA